MSKEAIRDKYVKIATNCIVGASRQTKNYLNDFDTDRLYGAREYYRSAIHNWMAAIDAVDGDNKFDKEMKSNIRTYWDKAYDIPLPNYLK